MDLAFEAEGEAHVDAGWEVDGSSASVGGGLDGGVDGGRVKGFAIALCAEGADVKR